ncbi:CAP domain-containing protein [Sporolactobacillus terrae]|uniref:Serine protease n=1 Tax=Sporolactobacillus terrae TaxID=269673 RepID=A0A410D7J5_9BACL|nr:CAP domain-containing protein [Sporolactobacillus terrae]QAA22077.1 hypothetical protein C0674_05290 [Sporolactobacillus terrae]QAA25049.1 hypothetical protein C0679_05265 [Sporolactobacillus terrae]UAK16872.1 hypothetical protein K7399_02635 [Sporolactobacillus terrae]BBN98368.1 serine protease [Sporolactobacillus terrae]
MKKKVVGLTIAGALALPLAFGGGQAQAASPSNSKVCTKQFNALINPLNVQEQQATDLDALLKKLGINLDGTQLQEQLNLQLNAKDASVKAPEKKKETPQAEKPKADSQKKQPAPSQGNGTSEKADKPANDSSQPSDSELNAFEQKVVDLTNQERTKAGLQPLKADNSKLSKMARAKSQDMKDKNYFDHQSPTYGSPFDMMKQFGISYKTAGENIAAGQKTPEEVVQGWMNSPGHRANILKGSFTTIGVGYVDGGSYGSYWTQEFIGN